MDCSLRAAISSLFLQLWQGNSSHPASPDPETAPGVLTHLWASAGRDTRVPGAPRVCPLLLSRQRPAPWHCSSAYPVACPLLPPPEVQLPRAGTSGSARRWDDFAGCPFAFFSSIPQPAGPVWQTLFPSVFPLFQFGGYFGACCSQAEAEKTHQSTCPCVSCLCCPHR